jgi:uncharacterized protein YjiS (DUF1127 family)
MIYFLNAFIDRIKSYAVYSRTRAELAQLDDRSLADLGFQRGEIEFIARKAAETH